MWMGNENGGKWLDPIRLFSMACGSCTCFVVCLIFFLFKRVSLRV